MGRGSGGRSKKVPPGTSSQGWTPHGSWPGGGWAPGWTHLELSPSHFLLLPTPKSQSSNLLRAPQAPRKKKTFLKVQKAPKLW